MSIVGFLVMMGGLTSQSRTIYSIGLAVFLAGIGAALLGGIGRPIFGRRHLW